jgi:hypothetical protein
MFVTRHAYDSQGMEVFTVNKSTPVCIFGIGNGSNKQHSAGGKNFNYDVFFPAKIEQMGDQFKNGGVA